MQRTRVPGAKLRHCERAGILIGAFFLLWVSPGHAERFQPRGVTIPDAPQMYSYGVTRLDSLDSGAALSLPIDEREARDLLERVLSSLRITAQEGPGTQLVTEWVLWTYDPKSGTGSSKPPRKGLTRTYERHRFRFTVVGDTGERNAVVHIEDLARQKEVDITPDSAYSWMQWQDFPAQPNAALTFMRRLQGNFESAMSSRLLPSTAAAPRIVEPVQQVPTPAPAATPPAGTNEPVMRTTPAVAEPAPAAPLPVPKQPPAETATAAPVVPPLAVSPPPPVVPVPVPAVEPAAVAPGVSVAAPPAAASRPEPSIAAPQTVTPVDSPIEVAPENGVQVPPPVARAEQRTERSPVAPLAVQGGLLVNAGWDAAWHAVLRALEELGVEPETSDAAQHMLTTQWIDSSYDKKNQQFTVRSKDEVKWAFSLTGKGRQRHRFQLILIPVDGGAGTMVYAYHTGFQEETDQTPDSSQTLLYWKDRGTDPAVAMAFLRRLRVVVR